MLNDAEPSKDNCSSNTVPANSQEMKSKKKQGVTVLVNVSGSKRALFYHCTPCLHYEAWKATKSHSATDAPWMPWTLYLSGLKTILDILSFLSSSFLEQKHLLEPCNLSQRAKRQEMCRAPRRLLLGLVLLLPKTRAIIINVWAEDHCVRITGELTSNANQMPYQTYWMTAAGGHSPRALKSLAGGSCAHLKFRIIT